MKTKNINIKYFPLFLSIIIIGLSSCIKDDLKRFEQMEYDQIASYLAQNPSVQYEKKPSGLYYHEVIAGTGIQPATHDTVFIYYTLYLLDGTQLETNYDAATPLSFPSNEKYVIDGVDEGVSYMKAGGKSLILIPSKLAYGSTGNYYTIGGFTPLIFDITLAQVKKAGSAK